jgi:hypothetical protein
VARMKTRRAATPTTLDTEQEAHLTSLAEGLGFRVERVGGDLRGHASGIDVRIGSCSFGL